MKNINSTIIVAFIAAIASLVVAIINFLATKKNQRELEIVRDQIAERKSERDALRDYEYEARKRLYLECGPLIFQLLELSEGAYSRIRSLARTAAQGNLGKVDDWLSRSYYKSSTFYKLLAPLAVIKLIQRRLTLIDISIDKHIYIQYSLAKQIYQSFSDDFWIAKVTEFELEYNPHINGAETKRISEPAIYWQQGVPEGILDNAVMSLIIIDTPGNSRVKSFSEFENDFTSNNPNVSNTFKPIEYIFSQFHPKTKPILWRILVCEAQIYNMLLKSKNRGEIKIDEIIHNRISKDEQKRFDWRQLTGKSDGNTVNDEPFLVSDKYIKHYLNPLLESNT